ARAAPGYPAPPGRVPRVARLMALAIRLERLHADGVVKDYAALARLGHVSRARVSQVMALLNLAPDLPEQVLFLPPTQRGRDRPPLPARWPLAALLDWREQRRRWQAGAERTRSLGYPRSRKAGRCAKPLATRVNIPTGSVKGAEGALPISQKPEKTAI